MLVENVISVLSCGAVAASPSRMITVDLVVYTFDSSLHDDEQFLLTSPKTDNTKTTLWYFFILLFQMGFIPWGIWDCFS